MKEDKKETDDFGNELRRKAELTLNRQAAAEGKALTVFEVNKLVQELQLYQIELEMQNEQLHAATEQLEFTARRYEDLYDFAPVSFISLDKNALIIETNLASTGLFQIDRRYLTGRRFALFLQADGLEKFYRFHRDLLASEARQSCELAFRRKDDSVFWARVAGIRVKAPGATEYQCRLALLDITDQKETEKKLEESRNFVERVAQATPDFLTVYDLETKRNVYVNRELKALLGLSTAQVQTSAPEFMRRLIHPDDRFLFELEMARMEHLSENEITEFEYRVKTPEGTWRWLRVRTLVFQWTKNRKPKQIISIQQDVTSRKEAEEELKVKNQIVDGLLTNLPIVVTRFTQNGTILNAAGLLTPLLSPETEELEQQNIYALMPGKAGELQDVFKNKPASFESELKTAGHTRYFQNYYFRDPLHEWAIGFSIDITQQTAAEKLAKAERSFSENVLNSSVDGVIAFDMGMHITAWNRVMEVTTRKRRLQVIGERLFEVFPEFENRSEGQAVARVLAGEKVALFNQTFNRRDISYEMYLNPLEDEYGKIRGGLCILHNMSAQKKLEEESTRLKLSQQKSMLNAILEAQEQERKRIAEALHNGLGQLLYAAKLHLEDNYSSQQENIKQVKKLIDDAINETRTISFELVPGILADFGLETALQELLKRLGKLNLDLHISVTGLQKRLPENIEIAVYRIVQELINNIIKHAHATEANIHLINNKNRLRIVAEDNGIGFEDSKIKKEHKGIGLNSIENRLKLLEGSLKIDSRIGEGTIINIEIKVPAFAGGKS